MATLHYQNRDDAHREERSRLRRRLFGESQAELWKKLADQLGGRVHIGWSSSGVTASAGEWTVTIEAVSLSNSTDTRVRAPFVHPEGFRFGIYPITFWGMISTALGAQDIEVGDPAFDHQAIIKGNNPDMVRRLFANERFRKLLRRPLLVEPCVGLELNSQELRFIQRNSTPSLAQLRELFELFAETLQTLCHISAAYEDDPRISV